MKNSKALISTLLPLLFSGVAFAIWKGDFLNPWRLLYIGPALICVLAAWDLGREHQINKAQ